MLKVLPVLHSCEPSMSGYELSAFAQVFCLAQVFLWKIFFSVICPIVMYYYNFSINEGQAGGRWIFQLVFQSGWNNCS